MGCKQNSTNITFTLAAGSVASPYFGLATIEHKLCAAVCKDVTPLFSPTFTLVEYSAVGEGQYVATIQMVGAISYVPCGASGCATRLEDVRGTFTAPFSSATAPTSVTIAAGTAVNAIVAAACQSCSRDFVSDTPLTLTVETA